MKPKILVTDTRFAEGMFTIRRFPLINNVVVVDPTQKYPFVFEIDGQKYTQRVLDNNPYRYINAEMLGMIGHKSLSTDKLKLSLIELIQEYEKVLHKKIKSTKIKKRFS